MFVQSKVRNNQKGGSSRLILATASPTFRSVAPVPALWRLDVRGFFLAKFDVVRLCFRVESLLHIRSCLGRHTGKFIFQLPGELGLSR